MLNNFQLDNNPGLSEYIIIPEDEDEEIYPVDNLPDDDQMIFVPLGKISKYFCIKSFLVVPVTLTLPYDET